MASDGYLNLKEAAKYLGVSDIKIRRLVSKDLLKVSFDPLDDRQRLVKKIDLDALKMPRPVEGSPLNSPHEVSKKVVQKKAHPNPSQGNSSIKP
jgi:excisionase family DNA binding protein